MEMHTFVLIDYKISRCTHIYITPKQNKPYHFTIRHGQHGVHLFAVLHLGSIVVVVPIQAKVKVDLLLKDLPQLHVSIRIISFSFENQINSSLTSLAAQLSSTCACAGCATVLVA